MFLRFGFSQVGKGHAYSAARSVTEVGFDFFMGLLNDTAPDAHDKLAAVPHELWARYASRENVCWDQVTTNPAETANSMLLEVRCSRAKKNNPSAINYDPRGLLLAACATSRTSCTDCC